MNRVNTGQIAAGLAVLTAGGLIYVLRRTRSLLLFHIADKCGLGQAIDCWRDAVGDITLPEFVVYSLPGGLWATAYIVIVDGLLRQRPKAVRLLWAAAIPSTGVASELMQHAGWLPGTADVADLLCYGTPYIAYIIYITYAKK